MTPDDIGANQRIEPIQRAKPIHLHEKTGFGLAATNKKDPTNSLIPYEPGGYPPPSLLPPPMMEPPPIPEFPMFPGPADPDAVPPGPPIPGTPFVYFGGRWWAVVEYDRDTGEMVDPYWYPFAPDDCCGDGNGMEMLAVLTSEE